MRVVGFLWGRGAVGGSGLAHAHACRYQRVVSVCLGLLVAACSSDAGPATASGGASAQAGSDTHGGASALAGSSGGFVAGAGGSGAVATSVELNLSWQYVQISDQARVVDCAATGHGAVGVYLTGGQLQSTQRWYVSCSRTEMKTALPLAPGSYRAQVGLLLDTFDTEAWPDVPTSVMFEVLPDQTTVVVPMVKVSFARYSFKWQVQRAGTPTTCGNVNASQLRISYTQGVLTTSLLAPCSQGVAESLFGLGEYAWKAELINSDQKVIASSELADPIRVTSSSASPLSPIIFDLPE